MQNRAPLFLIAALFAASAFALDFVAEKVDIVILGDGYLRVDCLYTYRLEKNCSTKIPVVYPVPRDSPHGVPDSVFAFYAGDAIALPPFTISEKSPFATTRFVLPESPECEKVWRIYYRQPITGKMAKYIVTTLQLWRKPIERAEFSITYPDSFENIYISFAPTGKTEDSGFITAHFFFENWMPERDIIFEWN